MAKKKSSKAKPDEAPPEAVAPEALPDVRDHTYEIAPGCSMNCSGRIRGPGTPVKPSDLHSDPAVANDAFDVHLKSGVIVAVE